MGIGTRPKNVLSLKFIIISRNPKETLHICILSIVLPYFNFLIFSLVLWNSCFPMRREKVFERKNMIFPEISISMFNHLKLASQANSKHIFTGQKNSALVSLQFSKLATGTRVEHRSFNTSRISYKSLFSRNSVCENLVSCLVWHCIWLFTYECRTSQCLEEFNLFQWVRDCITAETNPTIVLLLLVL